MYHLAGNEENSFSNILLKTSRLLSNRKELLPDTFLNTFLFKKSMKLAGVLIQKLTNRMVFSIF